MGKRDISVCRASARRARAWAAVSGGLAVGWMGACASQGVPPGGPPDQRPPVVVRTEPDTFEVVTDPDAPIRFHFDERISEGQGGGALDAAVTISPRTGAVRVDHDRRALSVEVSGGLRPGLVYRVTLQPVVQDMFGNQLLAPFELVFSTGGEPNPATLAGEVWDRVQGGGVDGAVVQAVGADSLVHQAVAGPEGIYALRYLPVGTFELTAFVDQNGDWEVDDADVRGLGRAEIGPADTVLVDIPVLAPDTTPAVVLRAEALDSVTVVVELDDYLDAAVATEGVTVELTREEGAAPAVARLFQEHEYAQYVEEVVDSLARLDSIDAAASAASAAARRDSARAGDSTGATDTLAAPNAVLVGDTLATPDTLALPDDAVPPDTVVLAELLTTLMGADTVPVQPGRMPPPALPGARAGPGGDASLDRGRGPLPGTRLVGVLERPLELGVDYSVAVAGVRNINGLDGGGGEAVLRFTAEVDTAGTVGDTAAVVPDTGVVVPDTAGGAGDTSAGTDARVAPGEHSVPRAPHRAHPSPARRSLGAHG